MSQWSLKRSKPFFWAEARAASISTAQATKIENEARAFGLGEGLAFPMYDARSWQAVISLATSDKCDLDKSSIANLYLLSLYCKMTACVCSLGLPTEEPFFRRGSRKSSNGFP